MRHLRLLGAAAILALVGCANQPATYQADQSRALNIAHAAGLWEAEDHAVPKDQREGLASAGFDITTGTALFNTPHGLGLSLRDAAGLSVLTYLLAPPAQLERDAILAWIPSTEASNQHEAVLALSAALLDVTQEALEANGMNYRVEYHDRERKALLDTYYDADRVYQRGVRVRVSLPAFPS